MQKDGRRCTNIDTRVPVLHMYSKTTDIIKKWNIKYSLKQLSVKLLGLLSSWIFEVLKALNVLVSGYTCYQSDHSSTCWRTKQHYRPQKTVQFSVGAHTFTFAVICVARQHLAKREEIHKAGRAWSLKILTSFETRRERERVFTSLYLSVRFWWRFLSSFMM